MEEKIKTKPGPKPKDPSQKMKRIMVRVRPDQVSKLQGMANYSKVIREFIDSVGTVI